MGLQLLEADTIRLDDAVEIDEEEKEEWVEVEAVPVIIELEDDGVGVGEMVVSSSVEMTELRVELARTVDWAEAWATYLISVVGRSTKVLTVVDSSSPPSRGPSTPVDDFCLATNSCRR